MCKCGRMIDPEDFCRTCDKQKLAAVVSANKPKPHVHAAAIKAWADGAEIEVYLCLSKRWKKVNPSDGCASWSEDLVYRVKPVHPTLAEIAKAAWYADRSAPAWDRVAQAIQHALETGEHA